MISVPLLLASRLRELVLVCGVEQWLGARFSKLRIDRISSTFPLMRTAGLGVLPCYLADGDPHLVCLGAPIDELSSDLWVLTHRELRHTVRMRALSDFLAREFGAPRPLFHGETA